jgi:hypothetical protein
MFEPVRNYVGYVATHPIGATIITCKKTPTILWLYKTNATEINSISKFADLL